MEWQFWDKLDAKMVDLKDDWKVLTTEKLKE